MNETVRKTFKEKLRPTPAQERALESRLVALPHLYNTALEQRITAWQRRRVSVSRFQQEAELKDIRAEFLEYAAIHSQSCKTYWRDWTGPIRRSSAGYNMAKRRASRAFKGRNRYRSFTFKEYGNGATLDNGFLVLSKIGRIAVHWYRPMEGTPKTVTISREADGWYMCVLMRRSADAAASRHRTGDGHRPRVGILRHARGRYAHLHPGCYRKAERA